MDSPHSDLIFESISIPKLFYSDAIGKPFERCIHCNRFLLGSTTHYMIEKVHKNYPELKTRDTLFEYAVCMDCYMELRKSLSNESIRNLENYMRRHVDLFHRREQLIRENKTDVYSWIDTCLIKNKPVQSCSEYQIMCECVGNRMLFTLTPYMVCDEAMDEMVTMLSEKTLGFFDDFRNRFLGPPPEVSELLKPSRVILM